MEPKDPIEHLYVRRADRFAHRAAALRARSNRISHARLAVFGLALLCLVGAFWGTTVREVLFAATVLFTAGFVFLIVRYRAVLAAAECARALVIINEHAVARVRRDWPRLPCRSWWASRAIPRLPATWICSVCASLVQLLNGGGATPLGRRMLRGWLLARATPTTVRDRQQAVTELARQLSRRQRFQQRSCPLANDVIPIQRFLAWAVDQPWLARSRWLHGWRAWRPGLVATGVRMPPDC